MENVVPLRETAPSLVEDITKRTDHKFRFPFVMDGAEAAAGHVKWTVKGLMISGGLSVFFGPPGSGKSFLAEEVSYRVAHGHDFFGMKTGKGLVVYLCGEGASGFWQRMIAWRKFHGAAPTRNFVVMPARLDLTTSPDELKVLIEDLRALSEALGEPIAMIVVDTLSKYFGPNDEDKAADMNRFIEGIDRIKNGLTHADGAVPNLLVVHHTGKNLSAGMRGSNALLGAADCTLEVTEKDDGIRQARTTKVKDSELIRPFHFNLTSVTIGIDADGDLVRSCVVEPAEIVEQPDTSPPDGKPVAVVKRGRGRPKKSA